MLTEGLSASRDDITAKVMVDGKQVNKCNIAVFLVRGEYIDKVMALLSDELDNKVRDTHRRN